MASPIRVLHIDDEPGFADVATSYLEREDDRFTTQTATSASEGLDRLREHTFDCIVSDYDMPDQNGIEFLATVRDHYPNIPFILFTGKGSEEIASEAISAGVTDYLQKESGTDQYTVLANRIRNAVQRRTVERDRNRHLEAIGTAQEGISILNADGEFVYVNQAYADLYGYDSEEMIGAHWELIYPDDEVSFAREEILPTVAEDGYWHGETTGLRADGSTFPEDHVVSQANHDEMVCTVRDLSARHERERELTRKTRAMDEAPVGITLTDPQQADNPLIYANDTFLALTGYSRDEVMNWNHRNLQGPETEDKPVAEMRRAIEAGEKTTVELRNYRKDGTMFWNRVSIAPLRDDTGTITTWMGFQEDVTDRKQREKQLRRERHRFRILFDQLTQPVVEVEFTGSDPVVRDVNPAFEDIFGYDASTLVDEPLDPHIVPEDSHGEARRMNESLREGNQSIPREVTRQTADGLREFLLETALYEDYSGGFVIYTDISDQKNRGQ